MSKSSRFERAAGHVLALVEREASWDAGDEVAGCAGLCQHHPYPAASQDGPRCSIFTVQSCWPGEPRGAGQGRGSRVGREKGRKVWTAVLPGRATGKGKRRVCPGASQGCGGGSAAPPDPTSPPAGAEFAPASQRTRSRQRQHAVK